jgi:hypothetical protein
MDIPHIHRLILSGPGESADSPPEKLVSGSGAARLWNAFSDPTGKFHAGHWQSEAGVRAVRYTETELCVIIEGRARLTDAGGAAAEFGPGEAFVIAAGFEGTWESIGRLTKIYAILEP